MQRLRWIVTILGALGLLVSVVLMLDYWEPIKRIVEAIVSG